MSVTNVENEVRKDKVIPYEVENKKRVRRRLLQLRGYSKNIQCQNNSSQVDVEEPCTLESHPPIDCRLLNGILGLTDSVRTNILHYVRASISTQVQSLKKRVTFGNVEVREYNVTLGDHAFQAFPLTLDWTYVTSKKINLMDAKDESNRFFCDLLGCWIRNPTPRLTKAQRKTRLSRMGFSNTAMIQMERRRVVQQLTEQCFSTNDGKCNKTLHKTVAMTNLTNYLYF